MTISSTNRKAGPFIGNDSTTACPFAFKVFSAADLLVVQLDESTGIESNLALNTDYTVALNANQNANPGGTVNLVAAIATGFTITITSNIEELQPTDLTNQGGFYPKVVTNALDRITILIQQLSEKMSRTLKLAISTPDGVDPTLPVPSANQLIGWNESATGLQNMDPTTLATIVAFGTAVPDQFVGDDSTTTFVLTYNPGALGNLDVSIGTATQRNGIDFTWDGGQNLTFTTPPPAPSTPGDKNIQVRYMRGLAQGASDGAATSFIQDLPGAVQRSVQGKGRETVSVFDFMSAAQVADVQSGLGVLSIHSAMQAAVNSGAKVVRWPAGTYYIESSGLNGVSNQTWIGDGKGKTVFKCKAAPGAGLDPVYFVSKTRVKISGITFDGNGMLTAGSGHFPTLLPCVHISQSSGIDLVDCEFIGFHNCGLLLNICNDFRIVKPKVTRSAPATYINYGICISGGVGSESHDGVIDAPVIRNTNLAINAYHVSVRNPSIEGWGFSSGINFPGALSCRENSVIGGFILDGNRSLDADGLAPAGIENWGPRTTISNVTIARAYGDGIQQGGQNCTVTGNIIFDNGSVEHGGQGIYSLYQSATYHASGSIYTGNRLFETRVGAARTQQYGYLEQAGGITGTKIQGNSYDNNILGDFLLRGGLNCETSEFTFNTVDISGGTSAGTQTYNIQFAAGTKTGRLVTLYFDLRLTSATGTGEVRVSLPFSVAPSPERFYTSAVTWSGISTAITSCVAMAAVNQGYMTFQVTTSATTGPATMQMSDLGGTGRLFGSITYRAAT